MRTLRVSRPRSLRWRLTAWVAAVMLIAAAVVFIVVYVQTGASMKQQIDLDLRSDVTQMLGALRTSQASTTPRLRAVATRYVHSQPFGATSTLLFVLLPGQRPISNHPELFGHLVIDPAESFAQQGQENREAARLTVPRFGYSVARVPDVGHTRILERAIRLGSQQVVAGAGEPLGNVEAAQHSIARAFGLAGLLVLLVALIASYLAGVRVTAPLRRMASVAARVDSGDLEPRMQDPAGGGEEVRVLADSFNHMLDRLAVAFQTQREFMADASHELRTPLTVIRGQLEVLAATARPSPSEVQRVERVVQAEVMRMSRLVDDLLLLTAADRTDFLRVEPIELPTFVNELWDGLSLTARRQFELGPVPGGTLNADPDRLAQAVRNLGRNAIDHTHEDTGLVRLEVAARGSHHVAFAVIDDGPGIPAAERERVFERLYRLDPSRSREGGGAGLGLSIVRAIVEAHGGEVQIGSAPRGHGARVEIVLPGFTPRRSAPVVGVPVPAARPGSGPGGSG
ncbi:MAG TPA: HAMP domain-containing sensor histidine kinase [Solirubrobacteraceae bacterium]|nr:HAMP domain-containing sensor histidine kinase [Solirubrobacteraceae bacterium]